MRRRRRSGCAAAPPSDSSQRFQWEGSGAPPTGLYFFGRAAGVVSLIHFSEKVEGGGVPDPSRHYGLCRNLWFAEPERVVSPELRKRLVGQAVVVRGAGGHKIELGAELEQVRGLLLVVGRVEGLDPRLRASGSGPRPRRARRCPSRGGRSRRRPGLVDRLDRLLGGRPAAGTKALAPGTRYSSKKGPKCRGASGPGDVWAPDRERVAGLANGVLEMEVEALAAEFLDDLPGSVTRSCWARSQAPAIFRGRSSSRRYGGLPRTRARRTSRSPAPARADPLGGGGCLGDSGDRVVVGQGEGRDPCLGRALDDFRRQQLPVGAVE